MARRSLRNSFDKRNLLRLLKKQQHDLEKIYKKIEGDDPVSEYFVKLINKNIETQKFVFEWK